MLSEKLTWGILWSFMRLNGFFHDFCVVLQGMQSMSCYHVRVYQRLVMDKSTKVVEFPFQLMSCGVID